MKCLHLRSKFDGVISSDDFRADKGYPVKAQQKCLLPLRHHLKEVVNLVHGNNTERGQVFWGLIDKAFAQPRQWRLSANERAYLVGTDGFNFRLKPSLPRWTAQAAYEAGRLLRSRQDKIQHWWYFFEYPEVPSVNNLAEPEACRLAHCVSFCLAVTKQEPIRGSLSMNRFTQTADLLSVVQTCRRQGRWVLEFFQEVLMAKAGGKKPLRSPLPLLCT
jgi:transposase